MKGLLGKKLGMTQVFSDDDRLVPVTVIEAGPCVVTQVKTLKNDGYSAIQLGYKETKAKQVNKAEKGHFDKAGVEPKRHLAEFRIEDGAEYAVGQSLTVENFKAGDKADIVGWSKGKGFTGVMKRWGFRGGPGGHGAHFHRAPGSIGMAATPSRVIKGKKMPGRSGNERHTIVNLEIVRVDADQNLLLIKGAVPGPSGAIVLIKESSRAAKKI